MPKSKRKSKSVLEWQVIRLRASPAALVGYVSASDKKAALETAIKQFNVRPADQKRLIALRRALTESALPWRRNSEAEMPSAYHNAFGRTIMAHAGDDDWSDEETDDPHYADQRNFYKLEKWTKDGSKVDRLLYAGNDLERARRSFADAVKHRPRIRLTIRQRTRVLRQWPKGAEGAAEAALNKKPQSKGRG